MRKRIILFFLLLYIASFAKVELYRKVNFYGDELYFPKTVSGFLEELLDSNDDESLILIAAAYYRSGNQEAADIYVNEYIKKTKNYLKAAEYYNEIENYKKEAFLIEEYLKDKDIEEKNSYYNYLESLNEKYKIDIDISKYKLTEIDTLLSLSDNDRKFYDFYSARGWTREEKRRLKSKLQEVDFTKSYYFKKVAFEIFNMFEIIDYYRENILSIKDVDGFKEYFEIVKSYNLEPELNSEYERLQYLRYIGDIEKYEESANLLEKKYLENYELDKLYELYVVTGKFKIIYNLAVEDEKYLKPLVDYFIFENKEIALEIVEQNYLKEIDIKIIKELVESGLKIVDDNSKRIELIDRYLSIAYDREIFLEKIDLMLKDNKKEEVLTLLEEKILGGNQDRVIISKYGELNSSGDNSKLLEILKKLNDMTIYFDYVRSSGKNIDKEYEKLYINYLFEKKYYNSLLNYKDKLEYEMYVELINEGREEYLEDAKKRFPLEFGVNDKEDIRYFYFNLEFDDFTPMIVERIAEKENKTDLEIYYLARYMCSAGDYNGALELVNQVYDEYYIYEYFIDFYDKCKSKAIKAEEKQLFDEIPVIFQEEF